MSLALGPRAGGTEDVNEHHAALVTLYKEPFSSHSNSRLLRSRPNDPGAVVIKSQGLIHIAEVVNKDRSAALKWAGLSANYLSGAVLNSIEMPRHPHSYRI